MIIRKLQGAPCNFCTSNSFEEMAAAEYLAEEMTHEALEVLDLDWLTSGR